jgi:streptogramin lyase
VLGLLCALALAPAAHAYVLWSNKYADAIGRLESDGATPDQSFIRLAPNSHPVGLAVDGAHVYWASFEAPDAIGRANLDGTGVEPGFVTGARDPVGVAVDGGHLYWTNAAIGTIGRANLDGSCVNQGFITGINRPYGLAVDGAHVYWTSLETGQLGRSNLDGSGVQTGFISGARAPTALAVDPAHIYWTDNEAETIGRANLDGSGVQPGFISATGNLPWGVAVDTAHVYWTNQNPKTVGRADLDGLHASQSFTAADYRGVYGVAAGPVQRTTGRSESCVPPARSDRQPPRLRGLALSRSVFAAAAHGASLARVRVGTRLRYSLSEDSRVRFTVQRRRAGKRRPRRLRGSFGARGVRGSNRARFSGRLRGRRLKPGRYYLVAVATDRAGNRSRAARVKFKIRRR